MDFETLFYIVLVVVYLVYQIIGSRTQKPSPRPEGAQRPPAPDRPRQEHAGSSAEPDELDQALREIRQALGMESPPAPEPPPTPKPEPTSTEHAPPPRPSRPTPRPAPGELREAPVEVTPEPAVTPGIEDAIETRPSATEEATALEEVEITTQPASAPSSRRPKLLRRLREPGAAREAIVLSEILGPPRSRRR